MTRGRVTRYSEEELAYIKTNSKLPRKEAYLNFCAKFNRSDIPRESFNKLCVRKGWLTGRGDIPHLVGSEHVSKDGYIVINLGKSKRCFKHRYLWEQKYGKIPKGMALKCLDGNRQNTDPSNWEMIPMAMISLVSAHGYNYDNMPEELKPAVLMLARLKYAKSKVGSQKVE